MAKNKNENKSEEVLQPVVLQPKPARNSLRQNMVGVIKTFEPRAGWYHLVELKNGEEVPNSDFEVSPLTYERSFKDNKNFTVKKNPS